MKYLLIISVLAIASCANYEFGDGTKAVLSVLEMHKVYCSSVNDLEREHLLGMIRAIEPEYKGICEVLTPAHYDKNGQWIKAKKTTR